MTILVTGATGFVGRALCADLAAHSQAFRPVVRKPAGFANEQVMEDIGPESNWAAALCNTSAVVHLAARVHVMSDDLPDPLQEYRRINSAGTLNLARQCAGAGVRRFVFVSSIKVNGEGKDTPYRESDAPNPSDAYALSKWEAEQGLAEIARETGMELVVIRPPLVYGSGVGANFGRLMQAVRQGWPLPFGAILNRRSLLFVGNLTDAIRSCLTRPEAAGNTFLVDDGTPVSTSELVRLLAETMGREARLLPVPLSLLEVLARVSGRRAALARLTGSLWLDSSLIRTRLQWTPPFSIRQGLAATVTGRPTASASAS